MSLDNILIFKLAINMLKLIQFTIKKTLNIKSIGIINAVSYR